MYCFKRSLLWIKNVFPSGNTRESFPFWKLLGLGAAEWGRQEQSALGLKELSLHLAGEGTRKPVGILTLKDGEAQQTARGVGPRQLLNMACFPNCAMEIKNSPSHTDFLCGLNQRRDKAC